MALLALAAALARKPSGGKACEGGGSAAGPEAADEKMGSTEVHDLFLRAPPPDRPVTA
jgi:hypothetical protein